VNVANRRKLRGLIIIGVTFAITATALLAAVLLRVREDVAERRDRFRIAEDASPIEIAAAVQALNVGPQMAYWELQLTIKTLSDIIERLEANPPRTSDVMFQAAFLQTYYQILALIHDKATEAVSCESVGERLINLFDSRSELSDQHIEATVLLAEAIESSQLDSQRADELLDALKASLDGKFKYENQREQLESFFAGRKKRKELVGTEFRIAGKSLDGEIVDTRAIDAEFVLIEFWSTQCSACANEAPALKNIYHQFAPKGFEIVGVSMDPYPGRLIQFLQIHSIPWPQIFDHSLASKRMNDLGLQNLPTTLMLNRERQIVKIDLRADASDASSDLRRWLEERLTDPRDPSH
jgi:peroxiredoxin